MLKVKAHQCVEAILDQHDKFMAMGNKIADHYAKTARAVWNLPPQCDMDEQTTRADKAKRMLIFMAKLLTLWPAQCKKNTIGKVTVGRNVVADFIFQADHAEQQAQDVAMPRGNLQAAPAANGTAVSSAATAGGPTQDVALPRGIAAATSFEQGSGGADAPHGMPGSSSIAATTLLHSWEFDDGRWRCAVCFAFCNVGCELGRRKHEECKGFNERMKAALQPELGHKLWFFADGNRSLTACSGCGRFGSGHCWTNLLKPCPNACGVPRDSWGDRVWSRLGKLLHPRDNRLLQKPIALAALVPDRQIAAPASPRGIVQEQYAGGTGTGTASTATPEHTRAPPSNDGGTSSAVVRRRRSFKYPGS